jgi:hypothetical protein
LLRVADLFSLQPLLCCQLLPEMADAAVAQETPLLLLPQPQAQLSQ